MFIDSLMRKGASLLARPGLSGPRAPREVRAVPVPDAEDMLLAALGAETLTHQLLASRFGGEPDVQALRRVAALLARRPAWISAEVLPGDALFLYDMVRLLRPGRVVEIGTASGFSAAVLLAALADSGAPLIDGQGLPALETFDICERCHWDESKEVGEALTEVIPDLGRGARFHRGKVAADAPHLLAGQKFAMAYVDASHRHPCPWADTLMLAPILAPGAWVLLNDIALVELVFLREAEQPGWNHKPFHARGPQLLFEHWPWPKIRGVGIGANMAAVQVPDPAALKPGAFGDLLHYPWETNPSDAVKAFLGSWPPYRWRPFPRPRAPEPR